MFKAVLTVPCSSLGFADFPPGVHTDFRGSHTSLLSFKGHCSSQVCQSSLASPLCDINKATSSSARTRQETGPVASALKLPPPSFFQGVAGAGAKRGDRASVPTGLCCGPACGQQEGKQARACMASEEINYHTKPGARGLGEPYHTPSTALHQQPSLKLPPLAPQSSERGGQRRRATGSCEYQWLLILLVHPWARHLLKHRPQEPTLEPPEPLRKRHFRNTQLSSAQLPPPTPSPGKPPDTHPEMSLSIC